jgi:hypothetical protein
VNSAPQFYLPISYRVGRQLRPTDSPARALRSLRRRQQGDSAWLAGCRNPRTGIGAGCARAASGHPTVLPITLMKSRRRIPSPASGPGHIRFSIRPSEHEISTGKIGARWSILHSSNSEPDMSLVGQKPALPHRSIAVRSTSVNGHSARRGTAGLVGFMTIRSRWLQPILPVRSFHQRFRSQKIIFRPFSFDYLRPTCEIPPASRRERML